MVSPHQPLPPEVLAALQRGSTIEAIKLLRKSTGLGLKEAKDVIDSHAKGTSVERPSIASLAAVLPMVIAAALRGGDKNEAIRVVREKTGLGMKEANEAVVSIQNKPHDPVTDLSPGEVPRSSSRAWIVILVVLLAVVAYYIFRRPR